MQPLPHRCTFAWYLPQIIEDAANLRTTDAGEPLEAMLTQGINHLGIMRTITYAFSKDKASCWMLFEYCDCACVQVGCRMALKRHE